MGRRNLFLFFFCDDRDLVTGHRPRSTHTDTRCRPTAWRGAHKLAREVRAGAASTWMGTLHPPSPASPCHPRRAAPTEAAESPPTHTPPELDASPPRAARSAAHSSSDAVIASRISRCAPASSVLRMVETARSTCAWSQSGFARRIATANVWALGEAARRAAAPAKRLCAWVTALQVVSAN